MFVMEAAIVRAAERIGVPPAVIQQRNLLRTGDEFPYGQRAVSEANECWDKAAQSYDLESLQREVDAFNAASHFTKKGIAVMPVCFGISFTNTPMNQGRALVHVYTDGSVGVSTGAVEMGQGVNTKIAQVAARLFSLPMHRVTVHSTNTYRIANTSPSAASATADLNGKATQEACRILLDRLKTTAAEILRTEAADIEVRDEAVYDKGKRTELTWKELVLAAYNRRVSLSEHAHYATPGIHFDRATEKGHPFAYHVFGTSITTVTLDCLRGTYEVDAVRIVHDIGSSMNETIDCGQIEGGLVQGIGWMTMEEVVYDREGRLRSNALSTYKVPDIYSVPREIVIEFLHSEKDNLAVFRSKAVGEPPLMYGIGAYFAIRNAIRCFNPSTDPAFDAPFTPEKVLLALYPERASALNE
jgi:xanthine dehydrogenase large subunit